jgi:broad specificity phosphatase PhoE
VTDIWLVRHGEAAASFDQDTDPPLSLLGREQAAGSAEYLSRCVPNNAQLLSSPKLRAQQTGEPFATLRTAALDIDSRFIELPSPGALTERKDWIQRVLKGRWSDLPESVHDWQRDIVKAVQLLQGPTVIFSHFLVINTVAAHMSGEDAVLQCLPANGSVHHLRVAEGCWQWIEQGEMLQSVVN